MPVDLTQRRGAAAIAYTLVDRFPGTRNTVIDEVASVIQFDIHFPGNLSGLVRQLASSKISVGERATVSLPVQSLAPDRTEAGRAEFAQRLEHGTEVWDVAFDRGRYVFDASLDGDHIDATIVPSTLAMHQIYDSLLSLGLVASYPPALAAG